ncbi:MAG: ABC transporter permease [Pseudomonadota bacterium]|nr:ABC transporter permease [Pseudomonadota bacterium]
MSAAAPGLLAVFRRAAALEARQLRQRPREWAMFSWLPALILLLVMWMFSAGLPGPMPLAVLDLDGSLLSRQLLRMLDESPGLAVSQQPLDAAEAEVQIKSGAVAALLVIPADFSRNLKRGKDSELELLHNAQWNAYSGLLQRDVRMASATLSAGIELRTREKLGQSPATARARFNPLQSRMYSLFNTAGNYRQFLGNSLMPALLFILAMTAGAWSLGRKLRDASLGEWWQASGAVAGHSGQRLAAIGGCLLWPWLGLSANALLALGLMASSVDAVLSSWLWLAALLLAFVSLSLLLGALLALLTLSLRMALSMTGFITAPAYAFSGVVFPLLAMPEGARLWANALPLTHYLHAQVRLLEMQAGGADVLPVLLVFITFIAVLLWLAGLLLGRALRLPQRWGAR